MKRLVFLAAAGLAVVALAGAVGLPELAGAQDAADGENTVTASGVGTVTAVPNEVRMSFGVESRAPTAKAAVAANADAMRKVINALRQARAREIATEWVSVYPASSEDTTIDGYSASNSISAVSDADDAPALIDAAVGAGANSLSGPGTELDERRGALPAGAREGRRRGTRARAGAREGRGPLARRDHRHGRRLRRDAPPLRRARDARRLDADRPRRAGDERDRLRHVLPPLIWTPGRRGLGLAAPRSTSAMMSPWRSPSGAFGSPRSSSSSTSSSSSRSPS